MVLTLLTIVGPMVHISVTLRITNILKARSTGEKCSQILCYFESFSHLLDTTVVVTSRRVPLELVTQLAPFRQLVFSQDAGDL